MSEKLLRVCQESLFSGDYSTYEVAERIQRNYHTLLKEFNPNDTKAKLGVATLFTFMKEMRNITPLQYMAHELGYALFPLDQKVKQPELWRGADDSIAKNQHSDYC